MGKTSLFNDLSSEQVRQLSALETERFFKERAKAANRDDFTGFLDEAGDEPPIDGDRQG